MNKHEQRAINSYGKIADIYDDSFEGKFTLPFNRKLIETVDVPEGGRLLDIACGNGRLLGMLRQHREFQGYGTDISREMVKVAKRALPGTAFAVAPCDRLPFDDDFFDVVTVCAAFHHFPDVAGFTGEARRVLAPGGRLYIAEIFYSAFLRVLLNPFIRLHPSGDVKFYAPEEITRLLESNGFECEPTQIEGRIMIITAQG